MRKSGLTTAVNPQVIPRTSRTVSVQRRSAKSIQKDEWNQIILIISDISDTHSYLFYIRHGANSTHIQSFKYSYNAYDVDVDFDSPHNSTYTRSAK